MKTRAEKIADEIAFPTQKCIDDFLGTDPVEPTKKEKQISVENCGTVFQLYDPNEGGPE